jgi:coenzyme F420-reducing hydrogenase gamma subunit
MIGKKSLDNDPVRNAAPKRDPSTTETKEERSPQAVLQNGYFCTGNKTHCGESALKPVAGVDGDNPNGSSGLHYGEGHIRSHPLYQDAVGFFPPE